MMRKKIGIIVTGLVTDWTIGIINEYKINFPSAEILLVTWKSENITDIDCRTLQLERPTWLKTSKPKSEWQFSTNIQVLQVTNGLQNLDCDVVMKCRSDQFIHNSNIFEIFTKKCHQEKIMIPRFQYDQDEFQIVDYCMISTKKIMDDFWYNQPYYDGSYYTGVEEYIVKNYVKNFKKDSRNWKIVKDEYFFEQDWDRIFQIEWEKLAKNEIAQEKFKNRLIRESYY